MSKKLDALMKTMNDCTVTVIHNNGPAGPSNAVAFIDMPKDLSTTAKLERAFMLTNSIDSAWYKSPEITKLFEGPGCRSSMVGDYVLIENEKFKVEKNGWSKV